MNQTNISSNTNQYVRQIHAVDMKKMSIFSVVLVFVGVVLFCLPTLLLGGFVKTDTLTWLISFVALIAMFYLHEGIHAVSFILFGKAKLKNITFGGNILNGMLYCTCDKPLSRTAYLASILMPTVFTLLGGIAVAVFCRNICWHLAMCVMLSGTAGDLTMASSVIRLDKDTLILDHPKVPAYYTLYDNNNLPSGFVPVTEEEEIRLINNLNAFTTANRKASVVTSIILGVALLLLLIVTLIS